MTLARAVSEGGVWAARGFQYQYLQTLSEGLSILEDNSQDVVALHVEGRREEAGELEAILPEAIDYELEGMGGRRLKLVQVRSVYNPQDRSRLVGLSTVLLILVRLVQGGEAEQYELTINTPLSPRVPRLLATIQRCTSGAELVTRLHDELTRRARKALLELGPLEYSRLQRATINPLELTLEDLRASVQETLHTLRHNSHMGIGRHAAALLAGHLVDQIFQQAGKPFGQRRITVDELRSMVEVDSNRLAQAIGAYDWGVPIGSAPPLPDVKRPDLLRTVVEGLAKIEQIPKSCAITGLSGVGKTSLAASFADDYGDLYDYIFWINAESHQSLAASFGELNQVLSGKAYVPEAPDEGGTPVESLVHRRLATYPGSWLAIFDNASDHRQIDPWLPVRGRGHVIVTSTNSSGWTHCSRRVQVGPMKPLEAETLLANRFGLSVDSMSDEQVAHIRVMGRALDHWPLALELGAGYMLTCGRTVDDIPAYVSKLRSRALEDEASIPPGYPRHLVAAMDLSLDHIRRQGTPGDIDDPSHIALRFLMTASYLGARQMPLQLALASALLDPVELIEGGIAQPAALERANFELDEVVRILRGVSFIDVDTLPMEAGRSFNEDSHYLALLRATCSMNEIVQLLVRRKTEELSIEGARAIVNRAVYHVHVWLLWAVKESRLNLLSALQGHAGAIAEHAKRLEVQSVGVALLYGNLATVHTMRGNPSEAIELLRQESAYVDSLGLPAPLLRAKIQLSLIQAKQLADYPLADIRQHLELALGALDEVEDGSKEAAEVLLVLADITKNLVAGGDLSRETISLATRLRERVSNMPLRSEMVVGMEMVRRCEDLIAKNLDSAASALAAVALRTWSLRIDLKIALRGLQSESLAWQSDWEESAACFTAMAELGGTGDFLGEEIIARSLRIALACAPHCADSSAASALMESALELCRRTFTKISSLRDDVLCRYYTLLSLLLKSQSDSEGAAEALASANAHSPEKSAEGLQFVRDEVTQWLISDYIESTDRASDVPEGPLSE